MPVLVNKRKNDDGSGGFESVSDGFKYVDRILENEIIRNNRKF
jgi:hypothetical protein